MMLYDVIHVLTGITLLPNVQDLDQLLLSVFLKMVAVAYCSNVVCVAVVITVLLVLIIIVI